jgi:hypothetical protein
MSTLALRMAFTPNTTVPVRPGTSGPEALFVSSFLSSGALATAADSPLIFNEPKLPIGFPDVVAVYLRDSEITLNPTRNALDNDHLRLLHHVSSVRATSVEDLQSDLGWHNKMLQQCIDDLAEADLLYVRGRRVMARPLRSVFAAKKIVAIEAKLDNWSRALQQASSNTWFASHSYVLIPRNRNLSTINAEARALGVGVMVFDWQKTEITVEAKKHKLPASYGSWLLNEWTIRRVFSSSAA